MKKLIIVRAGLTAWQEQDRIQGTIPLPLCEAGKNALNDIAVSLQQEKPDCLYSSGNESSAATADYLSQRCGLPGSHVISGFKEMNFGIWQGLRISDVKTRYKSAYKQWSKDPVSVCPPQGEILADVFDRVERSLKTLENESKDKTVILVAANIVSAVARCLLTETPLDNFWSIANCESSMQMFDFGMDRSKGKPENYPMDNIIAVSEPSQSITPQRKVSI